MIIKIFIKIFIKKDLKNQFDKIKELTNEINRNDLKNYFTSNPFRKRFDDFDDDIKLFVKIQSGEMKQ